MRARAFSPGILLVLALAGCDEPNPHPPDPLLVDSLGLEETDRVFPVELSFADGGERPAPAEVRIAPGAFVEFRTTDRRLHTVRFFMDSLPAPAADFLRRTGQDASPPLLEPGTRFVVSFRDAPEGRYPYLVEGNGEPARGAVVVAEDEDR